MGQIEELKYEEIDERISQTTREYALQEAKGAKQRIDPSIM